MLAQGSGQQAQAGTKLTVDKWQLLSPPPAQHGAEGWHLGLA